VHVDEHPSPLAGDLVRLGGRELGQEVGHRWLAYPHFRDRTGANCDIPYADRPNAKARLRTLPVHEIAARLSDRFRLLCE
jgi:hypothetical protein